MPPFPTSERTRDRDTDIHYYRTLTPPIPTTNGIDDSTDSDGAHDIIYIGGRPTTRVDKRPGISDSNGLQASYRGGLEPSHSYQEQAGIRMKSAADSKLSEADRRDPSPSLLQHDSLVGEQDHSCSISHVGPTNLDLCYICGLSVSIGGKRDWQ